RRRGSASTSPQGPGCASSPACRGKSASSPSPGGAWSRGCSADDEHRPPALCGALRPHRGRQGPPRRHRPVDLPHRGPLVVVGPGTEVLAGEGRILTAGIVDCHVHLICPQVIEVAIAAGTTTIIGGGTGPAEGTRATTVTPGAWNLALMLKALDRWPVNVAL